MGHSGLGQIVAVIGVALSLGVILGIGGVELWSSPLSMAEKVGATSGAVLVLSLLLGIATA